ncbi:BlaI/MecI/CopY family transcriptional regulator [Micromonospora sp. NPDC047620]|uniref:BlaI/MecI/CopY family transcriptional regulator n=1 Tax=Micromonospora sp. NPDC047620 TaxID=3364251 RepID=UPI0037128BA2
MIRPGRRDRGAERSLGPLESEVMNRLWAVDAPLTVRQMVDSLADKGLAYTTVMTVLDNLHRKGWAERDLVGRAYRYRPRISREEHVSQVMADALSSASDQHAALARFVDTMSPEEAALLRAILHDRQESA